jgi:hypothetical protein
MAERWKAWESKNRIPPLPTAPRESRHRREIPTFPPLPRRRDGKVENQKQVSHFPTHLRATTIRFLREPKQGTLLSR